MITFVTTLYNNFNGLKKTSYSLRDQSRSDWRHIIIDNYSKDLDFSFKHLKDSRVQLIRCSTSLYEGMNNGIKRVDTPYFMILNAGTNFTNNEVLNNITQNCLTWPDESLYIYSCFTNDSGHMTKKIIKPAFIPATLNHEALVYRSHMNIFHNSEKFGMAADVKFIGDYLKNNKYKIFSDQYTVYYERGGASDNYSFFKKSKDHLKIAIHLSSQRRRIAAVWYIIRSSKDFIRYFTGVK